MEVPEKCIFVTKPEQVKFTTQTNGDSILIDAKDIDPIQAASMAWLVNNYDVELEWLVRIKEP